MSVDIMYQPYASYLPYASRSAGSSSMGMSMEQLKFGMGKYHDPLDLGPYSGGGGGGGPAASSPPTCGPSPGTSGLSRSASHKDSHPHGAADPDKDPQPQNAQYLSANCVVVSYFAGDISSHVDDHFSRALSQPGGLSDPASGGRPAPSAAAATGGGDKGSGYNSAKDVSPMSQRNFPASFWNSNYQPPPIHVGLSGTSFQDLPGFTSDPYSHMTSSFGGHMGALHTQDPWRYPLSSSTSSMTSQSATYPSHAAMAAAAAAAAAADLGYSAAVHGAGASRFHSAAAHYGSLLPPSASASRFQTMGGQCDSLVKHTDTWGSRYHGDPLGVGMGMGSHGHDSAGGAGLHSGLHPGLHGGGIDASFSQDISRDWHWV